MKDIHQVQDLQPCPFNHVRCWDVAAKASSVHLTYSLDQKLGRKGGTRTYNSNILLLNDAHSPRNFHWPPKSTRNATITTQPRQHWKAHHDIHNILPTTMTQPTSCMGGATQPSHSEWHLQPLFWPECARHSTVVLDLINQLNHLLPGQRRGCGMGQRSHLKGTRPPPLVMASWQSTTPKSNAQLQATKPVSINTHTQCTPVTRYAQI